ncbi:Putative Ecp2 effector protein [Septoria linicola]|uniref:Ecp2 effector protein n=1 Tax=Septoria linicola TaxID=215465 RepID=A0A9Q9ACD4_9PEZI|nr:putative Ecp2 effector protein [Septoria linicola]USW46954.1 Putative Ecp2 effector protein [Septoria linicola]
MHFSNTLLIALLPSLGLATSYRRKPSNDQAAMLMASNVQSNNGNNGNNNAGNAPGINDCGDSSFIELTQNQDNNPSVDDCQAMLTTIQQDQEWTVTSTGQTIVSYGTCAFNAVVTSGQADYLTAKIGNADVIDLVSDSIKKFERDGTVGCQGGYNMYVSSAGAMPCDSPDVAAGQQVRVDWTLTHV